MSPTDHADTAWHPGNPYFPRAAGGWQHAITIKLSARASVIQLACDHVYGLTMIGPASPAGVDGAVEGIPQLGEETGWRVLWVA
ncbi:hypothetical protein EX30DRAFT_339763 [Ascodesmis nigricans]|uniref:Uncharacterized protein n=1 Tax=Ascodesmis nigricans TaxID=341454 RepID=A0A4S2N0E5_9PEZI|nr:hypothetical protein EX30DRAFT_339763 [Ascodesmis nigricans]